jgi:O-methyltransferase involved in polyketide biosynthesis
VSDDPSGFEPRPTGKIDTTVPHSARIWNYWLGGKDNYPIDQAVGEELTGIFPGFVELARADRYFLARAVRYLAGEAGVRQFLDIGTGLPTVDNTHEVAQRVAPESRIVYVDNDPLVLAHARALLTSRPEGACDYIDADLHDPAAILTTAAATLDFTQPVAVMLLGVLGHLGDDQEARSIITRLMDATAAGSYLVIAHGSSTSEALSEAGRRYNASGAAPYHVRSPEQVTRLFGGLELIEPGVVPVPWWRPDPSPFSQSSEVYSYCGVARKNQP